MATMLTLGTGMREYLGKHAITQVRLPGMIDFLRVLFIAQLFYTFCIVLNKLTVLAFYWRLFSVKSRAPLLAVGAIVVSWCIGIVGL